MGVLIPQLVAVAALQIVYRSGGLVPLNYAAIMGVGGYVYALASGTASSGLWVGLFLGGVSASIVAFLFYPTLNASDRRFSLATLAFQFIFIAGCKASQVTGGEGGIRGLSSPIILDGFPGKAEWKLLIAQIVLGAIMIGFLITLEKSRLVLKLRATADDPGLAEDLGFSVKNIQLVTLCISFAVTGVAGVMVAAFRGGVSADDFGIAPSVFLLAGAALAWDRSVLAAIVTAVFLTLAAELVRIMSINSEAEKILYGVLIILSIGRGQRNA